jgi:CrcB protein
MRLLMQYVAVGAAGSVGTMLRFFVAAVCGRFFGTGFPVGTFLINVTGSLFLGWFMTVTRERIIVSDLVRLAIAVGFTGGYTTFSTFAYESNSLLRDGSEIKALVNLIGSLVVGVLAVRGGVWLGGR